jgi:tetratricopeptide (TPR) repeat protein
MKAGVTPVLTVAWWKANKSTLVSGTAMEAALKKYEAAKTEFEKAIKTPAADGYAAYMTVKTILGTEVVKAVDTAIASCNKTLHKDDIAGLNKYKTNVIPAAKTALDNDFKEYKTKHETEFNNMVNGMTQFMKLLEPIAVLSANTVLQCEAIAPEADKALIMATNANGNIQAANTAMNQANNAGRQIAEKYHALDEAIKKAPKNWPMDRSKVLQSDNAAVMKMGDRKFTMEQQIENNFTKVGKINQSVQAVMSKTRMIAEGKASAEEALVGAFDRLVNRAFSLVQGNDVQAREMKSALSNLGGDIEGYAQAKDPSAKEQFKKKAGDNLRMAKVQGGALATALKKSKEEIDGALNSMPKNVVNRQNPAFAKLFTELDKALKAFTQDGELLQKEGQRMKTLEIEVAKMV